MNKKELISKTVEVLHENDVRKHVAAQKTVLHISDDFGNKSDFIIKKSDRGLLYTSKDVSAIIEAFLEVIKDSIKNGDEVSLFGFGTFGLQYRAERQTKHPETGENITINARYVPKFSFGNDLRMAARVYEMSLQDREVGA